MQFEIKNIDELRSFAADVLSRSKTPIIYSLTGDLGSGKTTFTKLCAEILGVKQSVNSPTFIIHSEYDFDSGKLHHIDLYRINNINEFKELNLHSTIKKGNHIFIEWADKFKWEIDKLRNEANIVWLNFDYSDKSEGERIVNLTESPI
jgi:tRNA threonylcarbamoyladenosine biosynthesis protein TsaE